MNKPTLYISGAITGVPVLNKPKFTEATKKLRGMGFIVINPHEICEGLTADQWADCMKNCIARLMEAQIIILLNDWMNSRGATIEVELSKRIGIKHIDYTEFLELQERIKVDYGYLYDEYKDEINVFGGVNEKILMQIKNECAGMYFHQVGDYWLLSSLAND